MQATFRLTFVLLAAALLCACHGAAQNATDTRTAVRNVPSQRLPVTVSGTKGFLPIYVTMRGMNVDLGSVNPAAKRAVVIIHGSHRDARRYEIVEDWAIHNSGEAFWNTLLIAPEFLEEEDAEVHGLPDDDLRWRHGAWTDGENAHNSPISSFDALDAILERLSNHILLPNLESVVLVGYAGGGLMVQRYAVIGRGSDVLVQSGVHLRFVVANPSSYLYFSPERPVPDSQGEFKFRIPARECADDDNHWRFGIVDPPPYAAQADFADLERRYIRRNVIYLLGTEAINPNDTGDTSCAGEDQGPNRFLRGVTYFRYLQLRHTELMEESASQQLWFVPGVGNELNKMLTSFCGRAALFDVGSCETRILYPKP